MTPSLWTTRMEWIRTLAIARARTHTTSHSSTKRTINLQTMARRAFPNNNNNQASNRNQHRTNSNPQISSRPKCSPWTTTKRSTKTPVGPSQSEAITTRAAQPVKVLACRTHVARPKRMNQGFKKGSWWSLSQHHHSIHKNKPVQIKRSRVVKKKLHP